MRIPRPVLAAILVLTVLSWAVMDYFGLPAYNFQSFGFWILIGVYAGAFSFAVSLLFRSAKGIGIGILGGGTVIVLAFILSLGSWLFWPGNDVRYSGLMPVSPRTQADFVSDFSAADSGDKLILPQVDKALSVKSAQGALGQYGAQFAMNQEIFTAVTVVRDGGRRVVRVSPLDYSGLFVAISMGSRGSVGYIEVDQLSGDARLVQVQGGMKYTPEAILSHDLMRHVRFAYRSDLFGAYSFEIDDAGKPFWIVPVISNKVGLFSGAEVVAVITVDPVSGETIRYAKGQEPGWIDRVIPTEIVMEQANNALSLSGGWFNSMFGEKKGVFQLSDGYNYAFSEGLENGGTWFVSGITSPNEADQTLIGFLMVNMRTKESRKYAISGITEMRAMEISESDERVKAQALTATWPILVDVGGVPSYFLLLKNAVQRQRFVYLDAATGKYVAMGDTIQSAKSEFARIAGASGSREEALMAEGKVFRVKADSSGVTSLFMLSGDSFHVYSANADISNGVRFLEPGDLVKIAYRESDAIPGQRFVVSLKNLSMGE